jgi:hypothetical protein
MPSAGASNSNVTARQWQLPLCTGMVTVLLLLLLSQGAAVGGLFAVKPDYRSNACPQMIQTTVEQNRGSKVTKRCSLGPLSQQFTAVFDPNGRACLTTFDIQHLSQLGRERLLLVL